MPDRVPLASLPPNLGVPSSFKDRLYAYGAPAEAIDDRRAEPPFIIPERPVYARYQDPSNLSSLPAISTGRLSEQAGFFDADHPTPWPAYKMKRGDDPDADAAMDVAMWIDKWIHPAKYQK